MFIYVYTKKQQQQHCKALPKQLTTHTNIEIQQNKCFFFLTFGYYYGKIFLLCKKRRTDFVKND